MPGSTTTPSPLATDDSAASSVAFLVLERVGTWDKNHIVAQWLACTYPYRRFGDALTNTAARLGANAVRYTFIAVDLHHLLLAGFAGAPSKDSLPTATPLPRRTDWPVSRRLAHAACCLPTRLNTRQAQAGAPNHPHIYTDMAPVYTNTETAGLRLDAKGTELREHSDELFLHMLERVDGYTPIAAYLGNEGWNIG